MFPRTPAAASGAGFWGRRPPSNGVGSFSLERFLFVFRGEFSAGNLLSASAPAKDWRLHHDLFGSGRGTSTLNLQIEFLVALRGGVEGAPFQRVFFGG